MRERVGLKIIGKVDQYSLKKNQKIDHSAKPSSSSVATEEDALETITDAIKDTSDPETLTTQSRFSTDRPSRVKDTLRPAPNAFVLAQYLNRLRGKPAKETRGHDSYVMHVDAPWGGGKTTFANFIANFLSYKGHNTPEDQLKFIDESGVSHDRLDKIKGHNWMNLHFNAWENHHVTPPWWNFYTSFLDGYKDHVEHPTGLTINEWWWRVSSPETSKSLGVGAI